MNAFYESQMSGDKSYFRVSRHVNLSFPYHMHPYIELIYVISGEIELIINDNIYPLKEGELGIALSNDLHGYNTRMYSETYAFIFSSEIISSYMKKINRNGYGYDVQYLNKMQTSDDIHTCLMKLVEENQKGNDPFIIKGYLYVLFGKIGQKLKVLDKRPKDKHMDTMQLILKYIQEHYTEKITLEDVSKAVGISKSRISSIFHHKTSHTFNDYINRLRINTALQMMEETDLTITDIAFSCGFESYRHFSRVFKNIVNNTPSGYRERAEL